MPSVGMIRYRTVKWKLVSGSATIEIDETVGDKAAETLLLAFQEKIGRDMSSVVFVPESVNGHVLPFSEVSGMPLVVAACLFHLRAFPGARKFVLRGKQPDA